MQIFDSHFHIIDHRYPLYNNQDFLPANFLVEDYRSAIQPYDLIGGAMVSGSFHGFDHSYIQPVLNTLGPNFVAVAQVPISIGEETIMDLHAIGVRGIRFNLVRGSGFKTKEIQELAHKVYSVAGWHSEFYINSHGLEKLHTTLAKLPLVSIDHMGLSSAASKHVIYLAGHGAKVKASGFGRIGFDPGSVLQSIHHANPDALMFGSDLPSTRAPRKFSPQDIDIIVNSFAPKDAEKILCGNALEFYRIDQ